MKFLIYPGGNGTLAKDLVYLGVNVGLTAVLFVALGYPSGLPLLLCCALSILIGAVTSGYVVARGSAPRAPVRGLLIQVTGIGIACAMVFGVGSV